jgi:hypothetical protein
LLGHFPLSSAILSTVIPKEGVESNLEKVQQQVVEIVIPKEGVESFILHMFIHRARVDAVIPKEGVESRSLINL